jgi:hypothetical protein
MSRLMADQESCGGNGDPGAGEKDSVMRVNLAEGCRAVNGETRLGFSSRLSRSFGLSCLSGSKNERNQTDQITRQTGFVSCGELCSWGAFLYKNECAGH